MKFELSKDEFRKLTQQNCYYCGIEPKQIYKGYREHYIYNGIDRIINNKGYVLDNCVPCCITCNKAKSSTPQDNFIKWINKVYNNLQNEQRNNTFEIDDNNNTSI